MKKLRFMTTDAAMTGQRAIAVAALVLLAAAAAVPFAAPLWLRTSPVVAGIVLAAVGVAQPGPGGAVAVLAAGIESVALSGLPWQAVMPLAVGILAIATGRPLRFGSLRVALGRVPAWATFACAAVTPGALVGWVLLLAPDLRDLTKAIPDVSPALLILGAAAFALLNALFEEWIWRGVIQARLTALFAPIAAIALQAASFGAAHAHGFPRGWAGIALAGTWGALLGGLRARAGGLLAPVMAHVVADATIAAIVLLWLR